MDDRKFRILQAIIDDYILTAIPVGSRTISKKYDMGLSSATIRNEMSDLEELGYLDQPHVSAGRIPSLKAYRFYVDQLLQQGLIKSSDSESMLNYFANRTRHMEDVIGHAAKVLSGLTNYTAMVLGPSGSAVNIKSLQLVYVGNAQALVVIVTDSGIMRDQFIRIPLEVDADSLYEISRMLTECLREHTLSEAAIILETLLKQTSPSTAFLMEGIKNFVDEMQEPGNICKIALGGASNILNFPEYNDTEKAKGLLSVLETKDKLMQLLKNDGNMAFSVHIGPENGIPELENCSLVTTTYRIGSKTQGTIGVIGPTRMQYSKVLGVLQGMGRQLTELLSQEKEYLNDQEKKQKER